MAANNPPPQAYTKEIVAQAYEWLFQQPKSTREMANSLDAMVALFLQARRRRPPAGVSPNPVSAKAFKDELKGLAEGFKQFEPAEPEPSTASASSPTSNPVQTSILEIPSVSTSTTGGATESPTPPRNQPIETPLDLDAKSLERLHEVMLALNLSSEKECLRVLITLGYHRVREILP